MLDAFSKRPWAAYAAAVAMVALTSGFRYALGDVLTESAVGLLFAPAILGAAMLGGLFPGLFATLLSSGAAYYFVQLRGDSFNASLFNILLLGIVGAIISWLGGLLNGARKQWTAATEELKDRAIQAREDAARATRQEVV